MSVAYDMHRGKKQDTGSQSLLFAHAIYLRQVFAHGMHRDGRVGALATRQQGAH